jgi:peptidoglycan/xylan/chitin deacetylase (PgdA/CDA1 family)
MNKEFHVCLSHDVDRVTKTFQFVTHFLRNLQNRDLESATYQVRSLAQRAHYWKFDKVMEIEEKLGLRSTFFFLNETYPFRPWKLPSWRLALGYYDLFDPSLQKVIKDLDSHGWEIGLHGSYLSFKDVHLLKREKTDLESIVGHPIFGIRQHYLNLDHHTWARQAEAGFLYDASFGFTDDIGFKESRFHPFIPLANQRFYVMPLAIMDSCVIRKKNPLADALRVIELAQDKGACLVLNWHQERFNDKEFPGWMELYLRLIEECRARNAQFTTIGEYIRNMS